MDKSVENPVDNRFLPNQRLQSHGTGTLGNLIRSSFSLSIVTGSPSRLPHLGQTSSITPVYPHTGSLSTGWFTEPYPTPASFMNLITDSKASGFFAASQTLRSDSIPEHGTSWCSNPCLLFQAACRTFPCRSLRIFRKVPLQA